MRKLSGLISRERKLEFTCGESTLQQKPLSKIIRLAVRPKSSRHIRPEPFVRQLLASATRIQLDIKATENEADTQAVIYVDGLSVGQELLYRYLAIEYGDDRSFWCRPKKQ